jgi:hypothetical protein
MEYELQLYACIQPANDVEMPELRTDKDIDWFGCAACFSQEEYEKYFPQGRITEEGFTQFMKAFIQLEAEE